jgi:AcrR family transcriptional regulator
VPLEEILAESEVKKGNFYYYFTSKEQFLLESIKECYLKPLNEWIDKNESGSKNAKEAIENYFARQCFIWKPY